jgi:superfamily II DNA or RNA helicase
MSMDNLPATWFDRGTALAVIRSCFKKGESKIRVASGFFTMRGWKLIRAATEGKSVDLLIGIEDPGEDRARRALIESILEDLRTGLDGERRRTVADLVERLENKTFRLVDARATDHHAKLYLVDCRFAIVGSSNTTGKGLVEQIESGSLVTDVGEVTRLVEKFDAYFALAKDLTEELLEALRRWLELVSPWDIYLKTMLSLEDLTETKASYPKLPVSYQKGLIARTLRQIREHRGSMLVASTGLGKTIVAVNVALRLHEKGEIDNILIVGPKSVRAKWKKEMRLAGLPHEYLVRHALDKPSAKQDNSLNDFEDIVNTVQNYGQNWLLIIDESHEWRNRYKGGINNQWNQDYKKEERLAFKRLRDLYKGNSLKVLLLTGSPYAKDIDNLNNQLFLLPHTAPNRGLFDEPEYADKAWKIESADEFIGLDSVVSQLTTPYVARLYGQKDGERLYINFGESKKYIPRVILYSLDFPLSLEAELTEVILQDYFKTTNPLNSKSFEKLHVKTAWASSPLALKIVLRQVLETPGGELAYDLNFVRSLVERREKLQPILEKLEAIRDLKLESIIKIVRENHERKRKVIIFCERLATVAYLKKNLETSVPALQVAATVHEDESDERYWTKRPRQIDKLIRSFAPVANDTTAEEVEDKFDVFISTDAYGVGIDMEDAPVVVNYDLAWTPLAPIQRAGRILRFWHEPRTVELCTFVPTPSEDTEVSQDFLDITSRWKNLMERHGESRKIVELPVLTSEKRQALDQIALAPEIVVRQTELDLEDVSEVDISPYFKHMAKLQENRRYAHSLPSDIISARSYGGRTPLIYVLLKCQNKYYRVFYDSVAKKLDEPNEVKLLKLLECEVDTPTAIVDPDLVERAIDTCIRAWCEGKGIPPEEVERECALYLKPELQGDDLDVLFDS